MTPADTLVPSVSEQSPPLAGTVRLRRSTPLAVAIVFAVVVIAAAGVASGLKKATGGFPPGYVPRTAHPSTQAVSATPYAQETAAAPAAQTTPAAATNAPVARPKAEVASTEPSSDATADATADVHPAPAPRVAKIVKSEEDPEIDDAPPPPQRDVRPMDQPQPEPDFDRGPPRPDNGPRQGYDEPGPYAPMPR